MCTSELLGKPDEMLVGGEEDLVMDWHPIQGGVVIIVLALC